MVVLEDVDDDPVDGEDGCTFLLGLMQKDGRRNKRLDRNLETIGFAIYKVSPNPETFHQAPNLDVCLTKKIIHFLFAGARRGMCQHAQSGPLKAGTAASESRVLLLLFNV